MAVLTADDLLAGAGTTHTVTVPAHLRGVATAPPTEPHRAGASDGAPEPVDDDATVVVRPLVLADVHRLRRAADGDDELAAALMLQEALVEPALGYAQVQQLPAGLAEFLLGEVNRVSGLSLGAGQVEQLVHAPMARAVFALSREFGWTPEQCAELTMGQVLVYLELLGKGERP